MGTCARTFTRIRSWGVPEGRAKAHCVLCSLYSQTVYLLYPCSTRSNLQSTLVVVKTTGGHCRRIDLPIEDVMVACELASSRTRLAMPHCHESMTHHPWQWSDVIESRVCSVTLD